MLSKIDMMKELLSSSKNPEHIKNLQIVKQIQDTFLFEGYKEYFLALIPKADYSSLDIAQGTQPDHLSTENPFPNVLCHNDIHQNNILMGLSDNLDLMLIDNEYAGWNPMAMDIAVYINEVMIDNSHPQQNGVKEYMGNHMSKEEQKRMINEYMKAYFDEYMPISHKQLLKVKDSDEYINKYSGLL